MLKKICAILITFIVSFSIIFTNAFAFSTVSEANNKYISLNDAKLIAMNQIAMRSKSDKECPWKGQTKISKIITLYDMDDIPNAYAFNIIQNGNQAGYVLVEANVNSPEVEAFSYKGSFYAEKMISKNMKNDYKLNNSTQKLYYVSNYDLLIKDNKNDNDIFYNISDGEKLTYSKKQIKDYYKNNLNNKANKTSQKLFYEIKAKNTTLKNTLNNLMKSTNALSSNSQIIYRKHDVPNLTDTNFYVTSNFNNPDNCSPTAGTTLIMYWYNHRGIDSLVPYGKGEDYVYGCLYSDMKTNQYVRGTLSYDIYTGLRNYAKWVGCPVTGSDYQTGDEVTYEEIVQDIESDVPVMINVSNNAKYHDHSMDVFGIEDDNDAQWLRVADGWDSGYQTWIRYGVSNVNSIIYSRWN